MPSPQDSMDGVRSAVVAVAEPHAHGGGGSGVGVYGTLRGESGVHRVQRVPATEAQGRLHTSTVRPGRSLLYHCHAAYCTTALPLPLSRSPVLADILELGRGSTGVGGQAPAQQLQRRGRFAGAAAAPCVAPLHTHAQASVAVLLQADEVGAVGLAAGIGWPALTHACTCSHAARCLIPCSPFSASPGLVSTHLNVSFFFLLLLSSSTFFFSSFFP